MLKDVGKIFGLPSNVNLSLKLENMQNTGSFKIRGVVNQFRSLNLNKDENKLLTFSAGNYGKSFAFICSKYGYKGKIVLPDSVSEEKVRFIEVGIFFHNLESIFLELFYEKSFVLRI